MKTPRILILFNENKIGTSIFTLPAIRSVKRHFSPNPEIWMMYKRDRSGGTACTDIISEGAEIKCFISFPAHLDFLAILSLILRMRLTNFSHAVYAGNSSISKRRLKRYKCLMMAGGILNLIGFHPHDFKSSLNRECGTSNSPRNQALCRLENIAKDGIDISAESDFSTPLLVLPEAVRHHAIEWVRHRLSRSERPLVAICPGAASPANVWPVERFIEIGRRLIQLDRYEMVVCGGQNELTIGNRMIAEWGQGVNAAGQLTVLGSAAVLKESQFMVGLDTGTTHLAAAVGVPCVTLQGGRMQPGSWDPLGIGHIIVRHPVNCVGCCRTSCIISKHPCMRGITVERVWQAVLQMLERLDGTGMGKSSGPSPMLLGKQPKPALES